MPEQQEKQNQEQPPQQPQPRPRRRIIDLVIVLVIMLVEALVLILILNRSPKQEQSPPGSVSSVTAPATKTEQELLAPTVDVNDVITSVKVDDSGSRTRTLMMSITLKIGRAVDAPSDAPLDLNYLQNEYLPKVQSLVPKIRDMLIMEASSRTYTELMDLSVKQQILDNIKTRVNQTLVEYGIEPRITDVYWTTFHFN